MEVQSSNLGRKLGKLFFPGIHLKILENYDLRFKIFACFCHNISSYVAFNMCRKLYNEDVLTDRHVTAM
jgi:hypothetical protein